MTIVKKKDNKCHIIDFAVPYDVRVDEKEKEKITEIPRLGKGTEEAVEQKCESNSSFNWSTRNNTIKSTKTTLE